MFFDTDIKGDQLPPKSLCLTFDDGPGPRTLALGRFLHQVGVRATFFAVGSHAEQAPGVVEQLVAWGHLVGSHTHTHPGLVALACAGGDVVGELARADAVLRSAISGPVVYFRAPYGNWRGTERPGGPDCPRSVVAGLLNRTELARRYVGPVNWDICACDWEFWERGNSGEACAAAYLAAVEEVGRGIILMHDGSEDPAARAGNRVDDAVRELVPVLLDRAYRFVRLDEVPQVLSAAMASEP
ncbi:MAG: polysaccharide deacetylase [Gemmataceae bacterium]|nr:polysaccharide deacetylase [Gemmataceae bacterium]